ncbi:MAG: co-chaperone GroES [Desulfovibrionaceae bacterium]|jgi:chaperonin GroES
MKLKPLSNRVVVKRLAGEEKTASGLYIPDSAKERPNKGEVLAAGPGKDDEPMTVKQGDTVLFAKYAGTEFKVDGEEWIILTEDDILAVVG